jgi:hypothetical protein
MWCLAQNRSYVPGSKQPICAWHPKVQPLRTAGFPLKNPAVSVWTLPGFENFIKRLSFDSEEFFDFREDA